MKPRVILAVDVSEPWLTELPTEPSNARTRDFRWYQERFASSGWHLTTRERVPTLAELDRLAACSAHVMVALSAGFDGGKERIVIEHGEGINELARRHPGKIWIGIMGEAETHLYHRLPPLATPEEALANYRQAASLFAGGSRRARVEALFVHGVDPGIRDLTEAIYGFDFDPELRIFTGPDKVYGIHPQMAWGADGVWFERSGWNDNVQIAISFLRGAAHQYCKPWALETSPWGGSNSVGRGPTTYDADDRHVTGISATLHWFTWISAMLGGASLLKQQAQECTFFQFPTPTRLGTSNCDTAKGFPLSDNQRAADPATWGAPLSPLGRHAVQLADLLRNPAFDRGTPVVPVALVVPLCHGWDGSMFTRENCVWGGTVPLARGDQMLAALFQMFLPENGSACRLIDPTFNPDAPFSSDRDMMQALHDGRIDMRDYERGLFVPTPLGDCVDVLTLEAADTTLAAYPIIILAGRAGMPSADLPRWRRYVQNGGTLVLHSQGVEWDDEETAAITGVRSKRGYLPGFYPSTVAATGEVLREGRYEYVDLELAGAEPLVTGEDSRPLLTSHAVGKGRVIMSAPYHHLGLTGRAMVRGIQAGLQALIRPHLPIDIDGPPVQYQVNRTPAGLLVALFNWSKDPWQGSLCCASADIRQVHDLWSSCVVETDSGSSFTATVPPYAISLYQINLLTGEES